MKVRKQTEPDLKSETSESSVCDDVGPKSHSSKTSSYHNKNSVN